MKIKVSGNIMEPKDILSIGEIISISGTHFFLINMKDTTIKIDNKDKAELFILRSRLMLLWEDVVEHEFINMLKTA